MSSTFRVTPARRALDILAAAVLLVLCAPVLLLTALAMLVSDGRPLLFRQDRVGEGGRPFTILKLRSMTVSKDGPEVTAATDARITRLGAFLRRTSIDELPQLWHVLRGDMTLVGPRPETVALAERYPASCRRVLLARPGLTGPAQLRYRERSAVPPQGANVEQWYLDVLVPLRAGADLEYLDRPTLRHTMHYIWVTALFVVGLVDLQRAVAVTPVPDQLAPDSLS
jgi:lipopolysaccharide/colanic/teichoic acid biosynthesis glycosyltransferase